MNTHDPHNLPADDCSAVELARYYAYVIRDQPLYLANLRDLPRRVERQAIRQPVAQMERIA